MKIKICHPNEIYDDRWMVVEVCNTPQEIVDHLASPSFETYDGLLAESHDSLFVFNGTEFVNLSAESAVMKKTWNFDFSCEDFARNKNFIDAWKHTTMPSWMAGSIRDIIPIKTQIKTYLQCIRRFNYENILMIDVLERWCESEATNKDIDEAISKLIFDGEFASQINIFFRNLGFFANNYKLSNTFNAAVGFTHLVYALSLVEIYPEVSGPKICDVIRREIPFYDVAVGLGKL